MKSIFTGVLIDDEHTLRDWGAIITNSDVIGMPEPNTVLLEVPGRSGRLDLSEVLTGDVTYSNREGRSSWSLLPRRTGTDGRRPVSIYSINIMAG